MPLASFCPSCGAPVAAIAPSAGRCTACARPVFANSRPAAGVFIEREGKLLLIRRGAEPALGRWDVPGGFLDEGEDPEEGARREIREELGVELAGLELFLVDVNRTGDGAVLDVLYRGAIAAGEPRPGSDAAACEWFGPDELPGDLAFPSTHRLLQRWRDARPREGGA